MPSQDHRPDPQDGFSQEEAYHYACEAEQRQDERAEEARVQQYFNARHDWKAGEGPHPRGW